MHGEEKEDVWINQRPWDSSAWSVILGELYHFGDNFSTPSVTVIHGDKKWDFEMTRFSCFSLQGRLFGHKSHWRQQSRRVRRIMESLPRCTSSLQVHNKRKRNDSTSLTTLKNTWRFVAFLSILVILQAAKTWDKNLSSKLPPLVSVESMNAFYFSNFAILIRYLVSTNHVAPYINNLSLLFHDSLWRRAKAPNVGLLIFHRG